MSSTAHSNFFQRGRINAKDLTRQDPKYILDYAARYDIPKTLAPEEIVDKIFNGRQKFIPILPNHTWALEDDCIVLTERREPPKFPHYQSLPLANTCPPLGDAFPEPPEDTFSRSPSPTSDKSAEERPFARLRLPLVYPPVGLNDQAVPDGWLQQMLEEYQEDHETVVADLQKLVEEVESVSYETVRVMSKIRKEQADTWRLLDIVKEVCGSEFLDKVLRDVHATTRFEMNRKTSGSSSQLIPPTADEDGGKIRSKKFTKDKQIFSMTRGSALPLDESSDVPGPSEQPSNSQARASFSTGPLVDTPVAGKLATATPHPSSAPESFSPVTQPTASSDLDNTMNPTIKSPVPARNKRSRPNSSNDTSDDVGSVASRLKRRKASLAASSDPAPQGNTPTAAPPPVSTSPVIPSVPSNPVDRAISSAQPVQRSDGPFNLWGPMPVHMHRVPATRQTASSSAHVAASSNNPLITASGLPRIEESYNLWTAKFPIPFERRRNLSPDPADSSQPATDSNQPNVGNLLNAPSSSSVTSSSLPIASSSRPTTTSSQPIASSSQPTASFSQPTERRRPAPLKRANERLMMNSDGTLELIDIDTPERIAASEELVRDAQRKGHYFTLTTIAEQCAPRYPFLFAGKKEDDYHSICPPSPRAGWGYK
ncbi:hypothetical protein F5879DRAFT_925577 [Lentinula edodes]|nr:hypothetical protein HHX47_DHR7000014 [Lentinula edodes]KAJ3900261.1 hypothetical protein F5879DRAFT_925577 [Lentinula edodes]KAJ3914348.1 hypothetical protein F5877DRAFT_82884 [Lentinula edodes]